MPLRVSAIEECGATGCERVEIGINIKVVHLLAHRRLEDGGRQICDRLPNLPMIPANRCVWCGTGVLIYVKDGRAPLVKRGFGDFLIARSLDSATNGVFESPGVQRCASCNV